MITFPPDTFLHQFWADNRKDYNFESFGVQLCQNQISLLLLSRILEEVRPDTIIEIGTFTGGLTTLFGLYGCTQGAAIHSFDVIDKRRNPALVDRLGAHFHLDDCFSPASDELIRDLLKSGRALVFCDGGNKIKEFNYYADLIKSGDIIACHDYAVDKVTFDQSIYLQSWGWHEISYADIKEAVMRNDLQAVRPVEAQRAALGIYMKS